MCVCVLGGGGGGVMGAGGKDLYFPTIRVLSSRFVFVEFKC